MTNHAVQRKRALSIAIILIFFLTLFVSGAYAASSTRVFVQYHPGAQAAAHAELFRAGAKIHYLFADLDSFVVSLPHRAVQNLQRSPFIASIETDPLRSPVVSMRTTLSIQPPPAHTQIVPYGVDLIQARQLWDANQDGRIDPNAPDGAGITICMIDTGFWAQHEDLTKVKIAGGYTPASSNPHDWSFDSVGHGTHVAGTIAAVHNQLGMVGVTPGGVTLFIVNIFGDAVRASSTAYASDLIDAAYHCAEQGAQIINMSLSGPIKSTQEESAFNHLYTAGNLLVSAASNAGTPEYQYPASYDAVISVAAVAEDYQVAAFSQFNDQVELAAPGVAVLSTIPYLEVNQLSVNAERFEAKHIENSPYRNASGVLVDGGDCQSSDNWSGALVLCERSDLSLYEQVMQVQNGGGAAALLYNYEPGAFLGSLGEGKSSRIVAVSLSQTEGQTLTANKIGEWAEINSHITWNASSYEARDGTSMAAPHVSAAAALLWSWNPGLSNSQIRQALQATALDLSQPGRDVYSGYGLVQAYDAWLYLGGGYPNTLPRITVGTNRLR
jgi:subtilisin family serine protease